MTIDVKVPVLAESISEATLMEWRKQPGEPVEQDEVLVELETDKVVLEIPSPEAGVLKEIVRKTGDSVTSNEVIARVDTDGAAAAKAEKAREPAKKPPPEAAKQAPAARGAESERSGEEAEKHGPAVRKLLEEHDLDPSAIRGTGKDGRLTKGDVLAYLEEREKGEAKPAAGAPAEEAPAAPASPPQPAAPAPAGERAERRVPMTRIRARIAQRLVEAQQTAAILTTFNEVDMQPVMELRGRYKEQFEKAHGVRLGFMSFFVKASIKALKRFPAVNAYIDGNDVVYHDYYDIGIAVGSPRGLLVPILRDADGLSFADIEQMISEFGERAKNGQITVDELSGGTFTISNGGVFGSLLSTPILNPPQSGILGMHRTQERPMVVKGEIVARPMMYLAFSYDHRIIDGREAVQFLVAIKEAIEDPGRMLLDV